MRKMLLGVSTLFLLLSAPGGIAKNPPKDQPKPVKLVLSPASTIPTADILKNLRVKCPNVSITLDSTKSDYMLEAGGWPGNYKFTMFKPGGLAVFATTTHMLSNAVKDVCGFIKTNKSTK
ncbi:MAG: hypothetical protein ACYDCM_11355 [Candidatus Acidiferrales bacterium]